jgi:hypothetical protein
MTIINLVNYRRHPSRGGALSSGVGPPPPPSQLTGAVALPYTVKKVSSFPVPIIRLFPARESLVSFIHSGSRKTANLFYSVRRPTLVRFGFDPLFILIVVGRSYRILMFPEPDIPKPKPKLS